MGAVRHRSFIQSVAAFPAAALSLLPSFSCPMCLSAYAGALSAFGITAILDESVLAPLIAVFLAFGVGSIAWTTRSHRRVAPLVLSITGAASVIAGRLVWDVAAVLYVGAALLVTASLWNLWLKRPRRTRTVVQHVPSEAGAR